MKKILVFIILSFLAVNISSCSQPDNPSDYLRNKIGSPEKLKKVIDKQDPKFVIVDVREERVYKKRHIPTAIVALFRTLIIHRLKINILFFIVSLV
jgi:hypothetical protein